MTERDMTLYSPWTGTDVAGWSWSEKCDGCRAYWDGSKLWTRTGRTIDAPAWLTEGLPSGVHLDCELWFGRGQFVAARCAIRYGRWSKDARLMVFDAPKAPGDWTARMDFAEASIANAPHAEAVSRGTIRTPQDLRDAVAGVIANGGEGLVIRKPGVGYQTFRTQDTLKVTKGACTAELWDALISRISLPAK